MAFGNRLINTGGGAGGSNVLYVSSLGTNKFITIDISDPSNMSIISDIDVAASPLFSEVDLQRGFAYVPSNSSDTVSKIDISDPSNMSIPLFATGAGFDNPYSINIDKVDGIIYLSKNSGDKILSLNSSLTILDISNPPILGPRRSDIDYNNKILYVPFSSSPGALASINISNPSNMSVLQTFTPGTMDGSVEVIVDSSRNIAFVISFSVGKITSIDISNPSNMSVLQSFSISGPDDITYDSDNQILYVGNAVSEELTALDVSNPSNITIISSFDSPLTGRMFNLAADFNSQVLYASDLTNNNIHSIDISNPSNMVLLNSFSDAIMSNSRITLGV